jgi:hypothetical protein
MSLVRSPRPPALRIAGVRPSQSGRGWRLTGEAFPRSSGRHRRRLPSALAPPTPLRGLRPQQPPHLAPQHLRLPLGPQRQRRLLEQPRLHPRSAPRRPLRQGALRSAPLRRLLPPRLRSAQALGQRQEPSRPSGLQRAGRFRLPPPRRLRQRGAGSSGPHQPRLRLHRSLAPPSGHRSLVVRQHQRLERRCSAELQQGACLEVRWAHASAGVASAYWHAPWSCHGGLKLH